MAREVQAKAVLEADTSDLTRGARQAKKELKDFGKVGNEITSSLGDAFGVDTRKLEEMSNAAKQMGKQLSESGNAGIASFGKLLQSIDAAKVALAGMGIGAAVGAFKLLNAEAENFKNTVAGANIEMATAAYISTYSQVMHDFNAETAKSVAEFESEWEKGFARFKTNLQQNLVNGLTGNMSLGQALLGPLAGTLFGGNRQQRQAADAAATRNEARASELKRLQQEIEASTVRWSQMEAQIADYRLAAKDDTLTIAQRTEAVAKATELINQRYSEEYQLRSRIATLMDAMAKEAGSSDEEMRQVYAAQKQAYDVDRQRSTLLKSLLRDQSSLTTATRSEANARADAAAATAAQKQAMANLRAGVDATDLSVSGGAAAALQGSATTLQIGAIIKPTYDPKEVIDISREIAGLVEQGVASISESLGGLIGDLVTGGDAWGNFSSSALSAFADMAVSVGKMAISVGVATEAIRGSLVSLNGVAAIAAGAALVALGSAVKSGMSNIASGNYSASASVATGSYGSSRASGSGGYVSSAINVKVSGTLIGDGNQLKAVIDTENSRRNTVT